MGRIAIALACALAIACSGDGNRVVHTASDASVPAHGRGHPASRDAGTVDASSDALADGALPDSSTPAADGGGSANGDAGSGQRFVLPSAESAVLSHAARSKPRCTPVAGKVGFYTPASIFAYGENVYVFSVDASEQSPKVLMHVAPLASLIFAAPKDFVYGAHEVDLISDGGTLHALAARQYYAVELESEDGQTFTQLQQVGPKEPTYACEGFPPPRYFRGRSPAQLLAMGDDYNTGVFGCYERVFVARRDASGMWAEPVEVGRGDVVFAFQGKTRASLLTTLGLLQRANDGASFETLLGFEASGGAFTGEQLLFVRGGGAAGSLALIVSADEGETWSKQLVLLPDLPTGAPLIAADGKQLSVAAVIGQDIVLMSSADHGATWTEPTHLPSQGRRLLALTQRAASSAWLMAGGDDALEVCVLD